MSLIRMKMTKMTADHHKSARQDKYFDALRNRPAIEIVEGRYREQKEKSQPVSEACLACDNRLPDGRVRVFRITEKLTDVNIAVRVLVDAYERDIKSSHFTPAGRANPKYKLAPSTYTIVFFIHVPIKCKGPGFPRPRAASPKVGGLT